MRVNNRLIQLVEVAFGNEPDSSLGVLKSAEESRLADLRTTIGRLSLAWHEAPANLVVSAKNIFPEERRVRRVAPLLGRDLGLATARSGQSDSAHLVFDLDGQRARIMIEREHHGWRVFGKVEGEGWLAELQGQAMECAGGQFEFVVPQLSDAPLKLESSQSIYELDMDIQA